MQKEISKTLDYNKFKEQFATKYGMGFYNTSLMDKFAIISLLGYMSYKFKLKNPELNTYNVLLKIINRKPEKWEIPFFVKLCAITDDFNTNNTKFETFGLKTGKEVSKEINRIIDTLVPF